MIEEQLRRSRNAIAVEGIGVLVAGNDEHRPRRQPARLPGIVVYVTAS
jgi:hypothetical protein